MSDLDEFKSYYALADKLMAAMTPEQLAVACASLPCMSETIESALGRYRDRIY